MEKLPLTTNEVQNFVTNTRHQELREMANLLKETHRKFKLRVYSQKLFVKNE